MREIVERRFVWVVALICLGYAALELIYASGLPLVMDEFQGARAVQQLTKGVPYRDFTPYKTVLGYYLQLPALLLAGGDAWSKVMFIKYEMVLVNAACIFAACLLLARRFEKAAICVGLVLLVCMSTFLERSIELRVDMPTAWFGLFSLLAILERRPFVAGLLAAASFLTSQKGAYFMLSGGAALGVYWLFAERTLRRFVDAVVFSICAAAPIMLYFGVFGLLSDSVSTVTGQVVTAHEQIVFEDLYVEVKRYWFQTMGRNPLFYAAVMIAVGRAFAGRSSGFANWALWVYGTSMIVLSLWHKQPWPYFFVLLIPTGFVLIVSLVDAELGLVRRFSPLVLAVLALGGVVYPLTRVPVVLERDNGPQENAVRLVSAIARRKDPYLAGVEMVVNRTQTRGLGWLDRNRLRTLNRGKPSVVIELLRAQPPKALIMNYRLLSLSRAVRHHLSSNYRQLHGNVHVYCPTITEPGASWDLPFSGTYRVVTSGKKRVKKVVIDGKTVKVNKTVKLKKGARLIETEKPFRLCLEPKGWEEIADPEWATYVELFDRPYEY